MVQHSLLLAIWVVPVGKCAVPKNMETGVQYVIRRTLVVWKKVSDLEVRISQRTILLAAGDCKGGAFALAFVVVCLPPASIR